ncbi:MAG: 3-oxoacyl-ACP reductase FabG [Deltaproteobacteria bacterium]|nr:MAG: 3-oxoacyl-ACP reductase FabG [Deltaproteobacteria bacterium]
MKRLQGKVAIVTGGNRGIGRATVERFIAEGARVAIWDIDAEAGQSLAARLCGQGHEVRFYQVDTAQWAAVHEAAAHVQSDFGRIDILVNNAGITRDASMKKMTPSQWQQVIDVNLTGVFHCTKAVWPYMAANGWGRILNAASVVAHYGNFGQTNYVASKAGVIGMTKVWAREFGRKGITVNAVAPGFIDTEMARAVPSDILDALAQRTPLGRLGTPNEVASVYAFLASDDASFITAAVINVDGGLVL